jgi:5-methylcytosine-specific restriction endonuclease McrA
VPSVQGRNLPHRTRQIGDPPICHPERNHKALGLCNACHHKALDAKIPLADRRRRDRDKARRLRAAKPEQYRATRKAWVQANREHVAAEQRAWRIAHPGARLNAYAAYAARKYGLPVLKISNQKLDALVQQACYRCGIEPAKGIDHLIPFSAGGLHVLENVRPCCLDCNRKKNDLLAVAS